MINNNMSIDEAFEENTKQFQLYEMARQLIKTFPHNELLHVGFNSGRIKSNELSFNLEYSFPVTYSQTRFKGTHVDKDTKVVTETDVPYEWINGEVKHMPNLIDFILKYRIDKKEWTIKPKCFSSNLYIYRRHYRKTINGKLFEFSVNMEIPEDGIYKTVQELIGWSAKCKQKNSVARKTTDLDFFKSLFERLIPAIQNDDRYAVLRLAEDARNNRAIKIL